MLWLAVLPVPLTAAVPLSEPEALPDVLAPSEPDVLSMVVPALAEAGVEALPKLVLSVELVLADGAAADV